MSDRVGDTKYAVISASTSGDNTLVAAVTGKRIRVISYTLIAAAPVSVRFESGAGGTALTGQMPIAANGGISTHQASKGHFQTEAGALLNMELSANVLVAGHLTYVEVLETEA